MLEILLRELEAGRPAAMATVVFQSGSAPRGPGARLLAGPGGLLAGTTGGGLAEAKAIGACAAACATGEPATLDIEMDGTLAAHSDLICGGRVSLLIEPFLPSPSSLGIVSKTLGAAENGCLVVRPYPPQKGSWVILVPEGPGWRPYADGEGAPDLPVADIAERMTLPGTDAALVSIGGQQYYCEHCRPCERLIIAGGGHVSLPTATIASMAGFTVHVIDDREAYACRERFPMASVHVIPGYADCFAGFHVTPRDYVIVVTRGHLFDGIVVSQALKTSAGYIGMIGSSTKRRQVYDMLREKGFSESDLARIHSPIGLSIGAQTPEEIAVSILAECIAHRHGAAIAGKRGQILR
ncbi:MAG: XdhC family protein [Mailhella sp.]|nr:XdhC family protein [Mailhella sp.]